MIREAIEALVSNRSLTFEEASQVMEEIMSGVATPAQVAAFITALRIKGESVDEIAGMASIMRNKANHVLLNEAVVDTCGTGGDNSCSFNVSTAAAFVAAGAGVKIAKHGNRAMSSQCGSADLLETLGVNINLNPDTVAKCIQTVGIGFMFAPLFHPAMKYAAAPRKEIKIRTVFNILGPLTNPAGARHQVIGVPSRALGEKMAQVLFKLGTKHSLVVHGVDGLDEISICSKSLVWEINESKINPVYEISPDLFGFKKAKRGDITGRNATENAATLRELLNGQQSPIRDMVVMNAAAALLAGKAAKNLIEGAKLAEKSIDTGNAKARLDELISFSQTYS